MSFARFSSDDFQSDVYAYVDADYNMITLHVAASRYNIDRSTLPEITADLQTDTQIYSNQWLQRHQALMEAIRLAETIDYHDEYAGRTYYNLTKEEAIEILQELQQRNYHIPEGTIEAIAEEPDLPEIERNPYRRIVTLEEKNTLGFAEEASWKK